LAHVNEVSNSFGEEGRIQSLVESFIGQVAQWWEIHANRLQTWNTSTLYFVERFGGKNIFANIGIPIFNPGFDLVTYIHKCEKEWKKAGYRDERV